MENDQISQLYRLKINNSTDLRDYSRASSAMPEGRLKKFFREQLEQKEIFSKLIDEEIKKLDSSEEQEEKNDPSPETNFRKKEISESSLLEWSRHREERNLALCRELLQKIAQPGVNQLLKEQELAILSSLNRLKALAEEKD